MKKLYLILYSLTFLFILGTALFLLFMPDTVPLHYNFAGEADRMGSKYEFLLMPIIALPVISAFILIAKRESKKNGKNSEKYLLLISIYTIVLFACLGFFFQYKALNYASSEPVSIDAFKFISICIGIFHVVSGNIMPKLRRNSLIGIRTKWSMENDVVWQKTQRFMGISSVALGLILIVASIFLSGIWNLLLMLILTAIWIVLCLNISYKYYNEYNEENNIN
ncbi:PF07853 family protein [Peptostreptococcaceae bacterium AS15]|nr:PF07853 family protein [Peptostreptococcaceae bacterium AS15]